MPLEAPITFEDDVEIEAVDVNMVLRKMASAANRLNIAILDACRNNPYARSFRSTARGLAQIDAPSGTLIAYAAKPGGVALDGDGENGLYTGALLDAMQLPGLRIEDVFKRVRVVVQDKSGMQQVPWESSSLTGDFYFREPAATAEVLTETPEAPSSDRGADDRLFWESIKDSSTPAMFDAYLQQFPNGTFAGVARLKRAALGASSTEETKTATIVPPPSPTSEFQGFKHLGCFKDEGPLSIFGAAGRDLSGYVSFSARLTISRCVKICRSRGFRYAGTQYRTECFCGESYGKFGQANNCNMPCAGDSKEICGGSWANSVFEVGQP